jgi:hypothetical protein
MCMQHVLLCHAVLYDRIAWRRNWIYFTLEICTFNMYRYTRDEPLDFIWSTLVCEQKVIRTSNINTQ